MEKKRCNFSFGTKEYHVSDKFLIRCIMVHHDRWYSIWPAVFQICHNIVLAFRKKDRIWWRSCFLSRECDLVPCKRLVDGTREFPDRLCLVHYNCRNSVWKAVFQDSETGSASIRSIYRADIRGNGI